MRRGPIQTRQESSLGFNTKLHSESGPLIGVVSKSKEHLIREYLGIPSYDQCLFFPGVRMVVAGLPMLVLAQSQPQNTNQQKDAALSEWRHLVRCGYKRSIEVGLLWRPRWRHLSAVRYPNAVEMSHRHHHHLHRLPAQWLGSLA